MLAEPLHERAAPDLRARSHFMEIQKGFKNCLPSPTVESKVNHSPSVQLATRIEWKTAEWSYFANWIVFLSNERFRRNYTINSSFNVAVEFTEPVAGIGITHTSMDVIQRSDSVLEK